MDMAALRQGRTYAQQPEQWAKLGIRTHQTTSLMSTLYKKPGLLWGFTGFDEPGCPYGTEARAMHQLMTYLCRQRRSPSMICDNGQSSGVSGLSSVIATWCGFETMGLAATDRLDSIGPRAATVLCSPNHSATMLGLVPDILVCVDGGEETLRACEVAIDNGVTVIIMQIRNDKPSLSTRYSSLPKLHGPLESGQLLVCIRPDFIPTVVRNAQQRATDAKTGRSARLAKITALTP